MRRITNKYSRPRMIWDEKLIEEDKAIKSTYGVRRKREIWSAKEVVRDFRRRARELNALKDKEKEKILLAKVTKLGLIKEGSQLDNVLSLKLVDILERRLQTIVLKKGFAKTPKQARQLITHGHIAINGRKATVPSYVVTVSDEAQIGFYHNSPLKDMKHKDVISKTPEKVDTAKIEGGEDSVQAPDKEEAAMEAIETAAEEE